MTLYVIGRVFHALAARDRVKNSIFDYLPNSYNASVRFSPFIDPATYETGNWETLYNIVKCHSGHNNILQMKGR